MKSLGRPFAEEFGEFSTLKSIKNKTRYPIEIECIYL